MTEQLTSQPQFIERTKTIIIEASETNSKSYDTGGYETILNKSIEINNGDIISLDSAFVDTSQINVENIFLPEDVVITWGNGSYVINQDLINFAPSTNKGTGELITDNGPLVFSQFHTGAITDMVLWTTVTSTRFNVRGSWGGVPIQFQVMNANKKIELVTVDVPDLAGPDGGNTFASWDLNIIGHKDYVPIAIDPSTFRPVGPQDFAFSSKNKGKGSATGNIYIPINLARGPTGAGYPEAKSVEIDKGFFTPVINRGTFTIPSGQYQPTHLAKILTDGFDSYNPDRLGTGPVPKNEYFPMRVQGNVNDTFDNSTLISVPPIDFEAFIEGKWVKDQLVGWNANVCYFSTNPDPDASPAVEAVIQNVSKRVVKSLPADPVGTFRIEILDPEAVAITSGDTGYPVGGGPTVIVSPPQGVYDGGSSFLQHTSNYKLHGVDAKPLFAFVDATENQSNVFNFYTGTDPTLYVWTGSNNIEVQWDDDHKRFKFNYLHFPITDGADVGGGPAIINQVGYAYYVDGPPPTGTPVVVSNYYRNYAYGSRNITTRAYGGCFFTSLEPFHSFWKAKLGFDISLLAKPTGGSIQRTFSGGFAYPTPAMTETTGFDPTPYTLVLLPLVDLTVKTNITDQLFVLGDLTGKPKDYTGDGTNPFSLIALPSNAEGRVAVSADDTNAITAGQGDAVGITTSGFYIADIDIGTSYNESIGSDSLQLAYTRNIRAIINRYYSANSYTSSAGNGISYIHYGNSFQLSSIKVRLTNSDGTAIQDLGTDNSIFLKVVKQEQINITPDPMPPPPQAN